MRKKRSISHKCEFTSKEPKATEKQRLINLCATVAQQVEQGTENPCVGGSIPSRGTIKKGFPHRNRGKPFCFMVKQWGFPLCFKEKATISGYLL